MKITVTLTNAEVEELLVDYVRQRLNLPDNAQASNYREYFGTISITITVDEPEEPEEPEEEEEGDA